VPRTNLLPQRIPAGVSAWIGRTIGGLGVTPNMISLFGLAGNALAAYLVVREALIAAGVVYLVFSALDFVDGAVARATNRATAFGAVFDAVLDRLSEALLLAACAWYFGDRGEYVQAGVTYAALFGSVAVSYMRARAEVMGLSMRDGIFRRQERVALVGIGLLFNGLTLVMWPLAILANVTALQRFWLIAKGLRAMDATTATPAE
jgi:CDP-diacylglycerol--glycerol-3-phosphate 3-phosphatidyltransferase